MIKKIFISLLKQKKIKMINTNVRLPKEHRKFLEKLSMEQNGTPNISNGVRILVTKAIKDASK